MPEVKAKETKVDKKKLLKPDSRARKMVPKTSQNITKERLEEMLPRGSKHNVTDAILDMIANMENDTGLPQDMMEEEVLSYMFILKKVDRAKLSELINAVKYCNLKRNYSNEKSWSIVFPDKYARLKENGMQIDNHVSMYNKSALVQEIDKEMLIPVHLQYYPYMDHAIKKLYQLSKGHAAPNADGEPMTVSPMVQMLASKNLYDAVKPPEAASIDLTVSKSEEELSIQQQMADQLAQLVKTQKQQLEMGKSLDDVQKIGLTSFGDEEVIESEVI